MCTLPHVLVSFIGRVFLYLSDPTKFFAWGSKVDFLQGSHLYRVAQNALGGFSHAHVGGTVARENPQGVISWKGDTFRDETLCASRG